MCNNADTILSTCNAYAQLDLRRTEIERELARVAGDDEAREQAWQTLETVVTQMTALTSLLATTASTNAAEVKAKAGVLEKALQPAGADPSAVSSEALALAMTVAREAARLI